MDEQLIKIKNIQHLRQKEKNIEIYTRNLNNGSKIREVKRRLVKKEYS